MPESFATPPDDALPGTAAGDDVPSIEGDSPIEGVSPIAFDPNRTLRTNPADPLVLSYVGVRRAIGISGLLLPVVLGPGGWLLGVDFQENMSSYYYTPLRDVFVGTLCAIGIFLLCYRGHDWAENWTANFGCFSALGIALFPVDPSSDPPFQHSLVGYVHTLAGGIFFLTLAFYSLVHFPRSQDTVPNPPPRLRQQNLVYRTSGVVILLSMMAMFVYLFLLPDRWRQLCDQWNALFWLEWVAVWSFAGAWLTKGRVIGTDLALGILEVVEKQLPVSRNANR